MSSEEETKPTKAPKAKRRFWKKKRWWLLVIFLSGLIWLDGPGWRWAATTAADHFLPELGYDLKFELEGRLSSGDLRIHDLTLAGDPLIETAELGNLEIGYRLSDIIKGKVDSIILEGLQAEVDLARLPPADEEEEEEEPKEPVDPAELLAKLRERLAPMRIELRDISARIVRGDELVFSIEPTSLIHQPETDTFTLDLGAMEIPGGRRIAAQQSELVLSESSLTLDRFGLMDSLAVRNVVADFPEGASPSFALMVQLDEAQLELETDLSSGSIRLINDVPSIRELGLLFAIDIPAEAAITDLEVEVDGIEGMLETLEGSILLGLADVDYDDWQADELRLNVRLTGDQVALKLEGTALNAPLLLDGDLTVDRSNNLIPSQVDATLTTEALEEILTVLRDRFTPTDDPVPPPDSSLKLVAACSLDGGQLVETKADLTIVATDDAPPISLSATMSEIQNVMANLKVPGLELDATYGIKANDYEGDLALETFAPDSLLPWLAPFSIDVPTGIEGSLDWKGDGDITAKTHNGALEVSQVSWKRNQETSPLTVNSSLTYAWPTEVEIKSLAARQDDQRIDLGLTLRDRILSLKQLEWREAETMLASGTATIPLAEDIADWKALLREERPIAINLETPKLPLSKLHPYLSEDLRFLDSSRGQVSIKIAGTPAAPEVDVLVTGDSLGLTSQADIPPASLEIEAVGKQQTLKVEGEVRLPEYPPAKISAVTNWDPDQWAVDPETVKQAKLDARVSVSDFSLTSLASFVPTAKTLGGTLNLVAEVTGTVGEPKPQARLTLDDGVFRLKDASKPRVSKGVIRLSATPEEVLLEKLNAEVSAGTVALSGSLKLTEGKPSAIDLDLDVDAVPAVRDDSMIIRLNSDLKIKGPWETATLSGDIGIVDSLFFKDIELIPMGVPIAKVAEPSLPAIDAPPPSEVTGGIPAPFGDWKLDVGLATENFFLIRGNLATGEAIAAARINGTIAAPRPSGEITLREIEARLPFSKLKIETGKVVLRPDHPFDPLLDMKGTSTIRPYEISVFVYGPVSDPKIQPASSPPLPETEVMTLLATGTTTRGLENGDAATARATQLLIEEARQGRIGAIKALRPVFSLLDKVDFQVGEVDPYTSTEYNSVSFELDDDWLLSAGISDQGNTRTKLTYLFRFR